MHYQNIKQKKEGFIMATKSTPIKKAITEFNHVLHDLKQIKECIKFLEDSSCHTIIITNQAFETDKIYTLTINNHMIEFIQNFSYYQTHIKLNLHSAEIYKNNIVADSQTIPILNSYIKQIISDIHKKKNHIYRK